MGQAIVALNLIRTEFDNLRIQDDSPMLHDCVFKSNLASLPKPTPNVFVLD